MAQPRKFDDAPVGSRTDKNKGMDATWHESFRRVVRSLNSRVLGGAGTWGTAGIDTAGLAAGTSGTKGIKVGSSIDYTIDGVVYSLAADNDIAIPASLGEQAEDTFCKYLVSVGTNGTAAASAGGVTITKGNTVEDLADAKLPDLPEEQCAIGYFTVNTTGGYSYTAGVTSIDDANIAVTYADLVSMPMDC